MTMSSRAIIFLQHVTTPEQSGFDSPVLTALQAAKKPEEVLFSMDNFSDQVTRHYALELIKRSEEVMLICDLSGATTFGQLQAVLNFAVKHKNVRLVSVGTHSLLEPFMIMLNGETVSDLASLKERITQS